MSFIALRNRRMGVVGHGSSFRRYAACPLALARRALVKDGFVYVCCRRAACVEM